MCLPVLQFVVVASIVKMETLTYDDYTFPPWASLIGWGITMSSMLFVPAYAIYKFLTVRGTFKEVGGRSKRRDAVLKIGIALVFKSRCFTYPNLCGRETCMHCWFS